VAEPVAAFLKTIPARPLAVVRLGLRVVELSTFPRRFSRLDRAARERRLARMERSRLGVRRDLLLLLKTLTSLGYGRDPAVRAALGVEGCCKVAGDDSPPPPAPRLDPAALEPPEGVERCDVVVVGSGAGGAAVARTLAERGLEVIVVEEGGYHDASTYPDDTLEALGALYRDGGLTVCEGRPAIPLPVGRCVGGTTVINSGTCFRTPPEVLSAWRDELGIEWATELDEEFEALERDLRVRPVDPATAGRNAELCRAGAEALGASNGPIARNAGDVVCCGTCPTGCAIDAKQATHVSELPRAAAAGARVRADARVSRVLVENGRACGVSCSAGANGSRRRYEVWARAVVVCAGALGTPALLLRQRLANASGALGRHLRIHPACWVGAQYDDEVRGWDGVMQSWYVDEWHERGLFLEATFTPLAFGGHWLPGAGQPWRERLERFGRVGVIGVHLSDHGSEGRVRPAGRGVRASYKLSAADADTIRYGIARAADLHFAAGAREVYPQIGGLGPIGPGEQGPRVEDARVAASALRLEAFHPMGTARMGKDPRSSVVGPSGEAHDVEALYVADASVLPTSLGVNPMITIMACARRMAAGLAERLA
jgi:choline dehydrogenase-like flavoprotein